MKHVISLLGALTMLGSAHASVISYDFTATIDLINQFDTNSNLTQPVSATLSGTVYSLGEVIHGHIDYDTGTTLDPTQLVQPASGSELHYAREGALNVLRAWTNGGQILPASPAYPIQLQVANNDSDMSGWDMFAINQLNFRGADTQMSSMGLIAPDGAMLNDASIPDSLHLGPGTQGWFDTNYIYANGSQLSINASLTSLTPSTPVPEPETYAMQLTGLALLGWRRHRAIRV